MNRNIFKLAAVSTVLASMSVAAPAFAQDEAAVEESPLGPFEANITVTGVSDYRFRGVSLSDKDAALQVGATIKHQSGLYVGVWASNIAENTGDDVELDLFAGFSGGDAVTYDIGATYYVYPGAAALDYVEFIGKVGTTVGPATVGATIGYVPEQDSTGNSDNVYGALNGAFALPNSPISVTGSIGYEDGAFGNEKIDWSLGLAATVTDYLSVSAGYVDTNRNIGGLGKAGAVFSATLTF